MRDEVQSTYQRGIKFSNFKCTKPPKLFSPEPSFWTLFSGCHAVRTHLRWSCRPPGDAGILAAMFSGCLWGSASQCFGFASGGPGTMALWLVSPGRRRTIAPLISCFLTCSDGRNTRHPLKKYYGVSTRLRNNFVWNNFRWIISFRGESTNVQVGILESWSNPSTCPGIARFWNNFI